MLAMICLTTRNCYHLDRGSYVAKARRERSKRISSHGGHGRRVRLVMARAIDAPTVHASRAVSRAFRLSLSRVNVSVSVPIDRSCRKCASWRLNGVALERNAELIPTAGARLSNAPDASGPRRLRRLGPGRLLPGGRGSCCGGHGSR